QCYNEFIFFWFLLIFLILKPGYHFGLAKICYSEESYCQFSFHHFGEVKQLELRMCTSGHVI
ncbi:unnamed protein product, partial [Brassica oleracea]